MTDLRDFRDAAVDALKNVNKFDKWGWRLTSIAADRIRLRWGYLDYLGEKKSFEICDCEGSLIGNTGVDGEEIYVLVGDDRWSDAKTMCDGVKIAINALVRKAGMIW